MNTSKKPTIIILHGWGLRGNVYEPLALLLKNAGFSVYAPDLPGFGSEPLVNNAMTLDDYVAFVYRYIQQNKLAAPILIGHSFGGRIAIKYVFRHPDAVSKIVLTGVPVIRHQSLRKKIAYVIAVVGGRVLKTLPVKMQDIFRKILYKSIGEWDYYKSGSLRQVFKNIVSEDLVSCAKNLKIPVLLVWGENDHITPSSDVEKIKKLIPQAQSIIVSNTDHKLPYLEPKEFFAVAQSFL